MATKLMVTVAVAVAVSQTTAPAIAGPQGGAMGVHFANADLIGDGLLDAQLQGNTFITVAAPTVTGFQRSMSCTSGHGIHHTSCGRAFCSHLMMRGARVNKLTSSR